MEASDLSGLTIEIGGIEHYLVPSEEPQSSWDAAEYLQGMELEVGVGIEADDGRGDAGDAPAGDPQAAGDQGVATGNTASDNTSID